MIVPLKKRVRTRIVSPPIVTVGGWTEADPNSLKTAPTVQGGSVPGWPGASFLTATMVGTAGGARNLPSSGLAYTRAARALRGGGTRVSNTRDMLQAVFALVDSTSLGTDRVVGAFLTDGTAGFGCGVVSSAGSCLAFALTQTAGTWTKTNAATVAAGAAGARGVGQDNTASATSRVIRVTPLDTNLNGLLSVAGNLVSPAALNLADGLLTVGLYFGLETGAGGSPGTQSGIAGEILGELSDLVSLS